MIKLTTAQAELLKHWQEGFWTEDPTYEQCFALAEVASAAIPEGHADKIDSEGLIGLGFEVRPNRFKIKIDGHSVVATKCNLQTDDLTWLVDGWKVPLVMQPKTMGDVHELIQRCKKPKPPRQEYPGGRMWVQGDDGKYTMIPYIPPETQAVLHV